MLSLGIQPSDALMLMEYEDIEYFIGLVTKQIKNKIINDEIRMSTAHAMAIIGTGSKNGSLTFSQWRNNLIRGITGEDKQAETLFTQIKKAYNKKSSINNLRKIREI